MPKQLNNKQQVPKLWRFLIFCFLGVEINNVFLLYFCTVVVQWPHGLHHARLPCPSLSPGVCPNSCPLSQWYHPSILCHPRIVLPSVFPSTTVLTSESALCIRWLKYWNFSFSISPSISLQSKGLSRVFSSTTVQKYHFFGAQLSLWSNSHSHTWLLEKPYLWLYGPLWTKWCLCFLICCLGLS